MTETRDDVLDVVREAAVAPFAWNFFALVRAVERSRPQYPKVGQSLDPSRDAIDLCHKASDRFPTETIHSVELERRRPVVRSLHLGLVGPMGPMPSYWTELLLAEESAGPKPAALRDFVDLLSARMLQLYYRAWADAGAAFGADWSKTDEFARCLAAASGAARDAQIPAAPIDDSFDDWRRLGYAGHLAGSRSPSAIADALSHLLGAKVTVRENVGAWHEIPAALRSHLAGEAAELGRTATLGDRFLSFEWDLSIVVCAQDEDQFRLLLPGGTLNSLMADAIAALVPEPLQPETRVSVPESEIAAKRMGDARLGRDSWIFASDKRASRIRADYINRPVSRKATRFHDNHFADRGAA